MVFFFPNTSRGRGNKENVYNIYKEAELKCNSVVKNLPASHSPVLDLQSEKKSKV